MYVPIMKNREQEMKVLQNMNVYFSDSIIPLVEILKDEFKDRFAKDPKTGEYLYELRPGKKRRNKIKLPREKNDIITLNSIQNRIGNNKCFIEYFRFTEDEYSNKNIDYQAIKLSMELSRNFSDFRHRILEIGDFENFIPVISIKSGFKISDTNLYDLILDLRKKNASIAIRISDYLLDDYTIFLEKTLRENDFLLLDIREQNVHSKFLELNDFQELDTNSKKILLNSPRLRDKRNKDYDDIVFTDKINNDVATEYKDYELDGFGDFGGLKDDLPRKAGSNGTGAALGLMYLKEVNSYFSSVNKDTSLGVRGYKYVRDRILDEKDTLDTHNDCPALKRINEMSVKFGSWKDWNNLNLTRYIHQQSTK